jgi:hypothetical protein
MQHLGDQKIKKLHSDDIKLQQISNLFPTIEKLEIRTLGVSGVFGDNSLNVPALDWPSFPALRVLKVSAVPRESYIQDAEPDQFSAKYPKLEQLELYNTSLIQPAVANTVASLPLSRLALPKGLKAISLPDVASQDELRAICSMCSELYSLTLTGRNEGWFLRCDQPISTSLKELYIMDCTGTGDQQLFKAFPSLSQVTIQNAHFIDRYDPSVTLEELTITDPVDTSAPTPMRYPSLRLLQYIFRRNTMPEFQIPEGYMVAKQGITNNYHQYIHLIPT